MENKEKSQQPRPPPISSFGDISGLKQILTDFYCKIFEDPMIGYLFRNQDKERLIERELEWTLKALGEEITYQGRPMAKAHQAHPIRRGHFHRRNQLLEQTLIDHQISSESIAWWMNHSRSMENAILGRARMDDRCEKTADGSSNSSPSLWRKA